MQITAIDNQTLNGAEGIIFRHAGGSRGALQVNVNQRERAGLAPTVDSFTQQMRTQTYRIYKAAGSDLTPYEFDELVKGIFWPARGKRTLTGVHEGDTYTTDVYIRALDDVNNAEGVLWQVTVDMPSGLWQAASPTVESDLSSPITVTGNVPALPTLTFTGGEPVTRQRVTYTDRTGHGVSAYLVSVAPEEDELSEENYVIYANGLQIPFVFDTGRLYFRIDCPPPPERTFVDIYQGASIANTVTAGRLDPAGTTLNAALGSGTVEADTAAAISNPLAPSLAWHPGVTYPHEQRRPYVFGLDGTDIRLVDSDVVDDRTALPDDVDSYVIVTGSEAERIRNLNVTIEAGYQKGEQEASGGASGKPVMRVVIKKMTGKRVSEWELAGSSVAVNLLAPQLDEHGYYTQWTMGLTTFPEVTSYSVQGFNLSYTRYINVNIESHFMEMVNAYMGDDVEISQGSTGVYYLTFDTPPPEMPLMSMNVSAKSASLTYSPEGADPMNAIAQGMVPPIIFESTWVDPVTKEPLEESADTAGLLPDPVRGQAAFVVRYRTRNSEHWIEAYRRVVTGSYPSGTSVSLSGLNIATPDAVEIALGLEPVATRTGMADWGRLSVTSVPTVDLVANRMPNRTLSDPIEAQHITATARNLRTGARMQLTDYFADGGVEVDTSALTIQGTGGVGPTYGRLQTNKGTAMFQLMPGDNDVTADGDLELSYFERLAI